MKVTPKVRYWFTDIYNTTGEKQRAQVCLQNAISSALQYYRRAFKKQYSNAPLYSIYASDFKNVVDMEETGADAQNAPDTQDTSKTANAFKVLIQNNRFTNVYRQDCWSTGTLQLSYCFISTLLFLLYCDYLMWRIIFFTVFPFLISLCW